MRRTLTTIVGLLLLTSGAPTRAAAPADRLWISPNPGTVDLLRMFEHPEEWRHVRALASVFNFAQQHTHAIPDNIVGPNTYDALVRAGAFRTLRGWGMKLSLGVGSVKEQYCTADASGMSRSINDTLNAMDAVTNAGGSVSYLAMDEPFFSGRLPRCGDSADMLGTADRLRTYMTAVRARNASVKIGLVEAYPSFVPDEFDRMLQLLETRSVPVDFLHVDVDIRAVKAPRNDMTGDMRRLKAVAAAHHIPMGIIVWGYNGDANALFSLDAYRLAHAFEDAFPTADAMPDQLIVASWSESSTGLRMTPSNLPESQPYTLTSLTWDLYRRFIGATGPTTGTAVPRVR